MIVVSILLALSADAWWEDRQEREAEQELYENLYQDLWGFFGLMRSVRQDHELTVAAIEELLTTYSVGDTVSMDPRTDTLVSRAIFNFRTLDARDALVEYALDNTQLIQNDSIVRLLQAVPRMIEDLTEDQIVVQNMVVEYWGPYLGTLTNVNPYTRMDHYDLPGLTPVPEVGERHPWVMTETLQNHLNSRLFSERFSLFPAIRLYDRIDLLITVLAQELGIT